MCLRELQQDDRGFSLIEVIMAVAILALVTLPIINYFTYSGVRTSDARDKQTATVVAENVLDELNSYDNFEQIESIASNGAVGAENWTVVPDPSDPVKFTYTDLTKKIKINGFNYEAKVHITYTDHTTADGKSYNTGYDSNTLTKDTNEAISSEYNDYEIPNPSEIYGKENVVAKEDDELDQAVSYFLTNEGSDSNTYFTNYQLVKDKLQRKIGIDVSYVWDNENSEYIKDIYRVKVSYIYELNGASVSTGIKNGQYEVPLEITEVKKKTLKKIYVFYNLQEGCSNEQLRVTFGDEVTANDLKDVLFYLCAQTTEKCPQRPSDYSVSLVDSSSGADTCSYLFNGEVSATTTLTAKREDGTDIEFVDRNRKKRIGAIEVSVYEEGSDEPSAVVNTTISE